MSEEKIKNGSRPEWDLTKIWGNLTLPELNIASVVSAQQKNIDAINMVNKITVEGWQAVTKQQTALWQSAVEQSGAVVQDVAAARKPADKLAMQAAFATSSIEASISNVRDVHEFAAKTTNKTVDIVSKRLIESIEESMEMVGKGDSKSAPVEK